MKLISFVLLSGVLIYFVAGEEESTTVLTSDSNTTTLENDKVDATPEQPESKIMDNENNDKGDGKKKIKMKRKPPSKKMASKLLPLLMIPLMIQSQIMPMMLFKLKLMALKALMVGKLALVIIGLNILRNTLIGADSMEQQYEQDSIAHSHYGYSGMPEFGSWVNRRRRRFSIADPYRGHL